MIVFYNKSVIVKYNTLMSYVSHSSESLNLRGNGETLEFIVSLSDVRVALGPALLTGIRILEQT